ncbi:MAG: bifunctional acetate--CoA ligase family protein/GNAT family N-acetyltransferase [Thalassobaculum sp.]|uniref:bifunctional acetate--CoA ligase family protein/GNAT family N-acetyltransferase n=1 Tax=Thalassobaculum sp. TaxID=2022740 RepID=UPI0032EEEC44
MSIRNLDRMFQPASVAVIGASNRERSVGRVLSRNLLSGGFEGPVLPVNPHAAAIGATLAYPDVDALPFAPDLAVICTPPDTVPGIVDSLGRRGTKAAVVITAGFAETRSDAGRQLTQAMLDAARPHLMRVVGPNCVGILVPGIGLNASFAHLHPRAGDIAFVSQSGAVVTAVLDWSTHRDIGFSHVVSLGNMADVDFGDMLDFLIADPKTRAILLYIESITHAPKFMSAARAAARAKPVIVVKAGRTADAARAAASHTGALAGSDAVYDAAFRRAGMLRVFSMDELFDAVETLAYGPRIVGDRLAIISNGGGIGVLATEALSDSGGRLAALAPETMARLDGCLPATWSHGNPVDIIGDAPGSRYAQALEAVLADPGTDAVLVLNCPTAIADSGEAARATLDLVEGGRGGGRRQPPVLTSWLGDGAAAEARRLFAAARVPTYETPEQAVRGFMHLVRYRRHQALLMETPQPLHEWTAPAVGAARAVIRAVAAEGREMLTGPEAEQVLEAYGVPVARTLTATTPEEAGRAAERIGSRVALKILSRAISHKSDVGGVQLGLEGREPVRAAAEAMLATVAGRSGGAPVDGFAVQAMAAMPHAHELIVGVHRDPVFGPTLLFGKGGVEVEVVRDSAVALPPLNSVLAQDLVSQTRVYDLLRGYRDRPAADLEAIHRVLERVGQLSLDMPEVAELDINPLLAGASGVIALDARIRIQPAEQAAPPAIRPYPGHLAHRAVLEDGSTVDIRPIRPEDEPGIAEMLARSSLEDLRLRFFAPIKQLSHESAARLTQIDYGREMAFVAVGDDELLGVSRLAEDPEGETAEFAVMVRTDRQKRGLGERLMADLIGYARERGIATLHGSVLTENRRMLALCEKLGFVRKAVPDDPGVAHLALKLGEPTATAR